MLIDTYQEFYDLHFLAPSRYLPALTLQIRLGSLPKIFNSLLAERIKLKSLVLAENGFKRQVNLFFFPPTESSLMSERRWILIFDSCEDWESVLRYMPARFLESRGTILVTTQDPNLVRFPAIKVSLRTFDQEEGSSMLLRYLQREHIEMDPERDLAREISSLVGGLPVAIAHVAGYVSYSQCPTDALLEIFKQRRIATGPATDENDDLPASFRQASFSYDETLAVVSHTTLRELPNDSQNLVYILAYLNCEAVPESMLVRIHRDSFLEFLDSREHTRLVFNSWRCFISDVLTKVLEVQENENTADWEAPYSNERYRR